MLQKLEARIKELVAKLEASVVAHNTLLGAFEEAKMIYQDALAAEQAIKTVVDDVIPPAVSQSASEPVVVEGQVV